MKHRIYKRLRIPANTQILHISNPKIPRVAVITDIIYIYALKVCPIKSALQCKLESRSQ